MSQIRPERAKQPHPSSNTALSCIAVAAHASASHSVLSRMHVFNVELSAGRRSSSPAAHNPVHRPGSARPQLALATTGLSTPPRSSTPTTHHAHTRAYQCLSSPAVRTSPRYRIDAAGYWQLTFTFSPAASLMSSGARVGRSTRISCKELPPIIPYIQTRYKTVFCEACEQRSTRTSRLSGDLYARVH